MTTDDGRRTTDAGRVDAAMGRWSETDRRQAGPKGPSGVLTTRCSFCAYEFTEEEAQKTCSKCASFGGCKMVMCPRCGYEMPQTPKLIKMLQSWRLKRVEAAR